MKMEKMKKVGFPYTVNKVEIDVLDGHTGDVIEHMAIQCNDDEFLYDIITFIQRTWLKRGCGEVSVKVVP